MGHSTLKLVITTVGTSLLEKFQTSHVKRIERQENDNKKIKIRKIECKIGNNEDLPINVEDFCLRNTTEEAEKWYNERNPDVQQAAKILMDKLTNPAYDGIHAPAEIASLWKLNLDPQQDKLVLLYSDTPEGVFCYKVIKIFLSRTRYNCLELSELFPGEFQSNKLEGIQPFNVGNFLNTGLINFQHIIKQINEKFKASSHLIINITAGYKGVIPWATIFAWNNHADLVYLYEEGDEIIPLKRPKGWIPISYKIANGKITLYMGDTPAP